jgi:cation diffusion facilitator CzcD-associated flavoprotein CzcO
MPHYDVVIVGAGLSGIGAAYHLQERCPGKSYAILETRGVIGGTWDLYRYPGIRSDSDMHTLGYRFKPWLADKAIADGSSILDYVIETADENAIRERILFHHRLQTASWSSQNSAWTLGVARGEDGAEKAEISCNFLLMCGGYFDYERAYRPEFEGEANFEGEMFHPQFWPEDLDYRGKRVVVIGSGATAMTIVPAMADEVEQITILQRSPTYVVSRPEKDAIANFLRRILPARVAYAITRFKNTELQSWMYKRTRKEPERVKRILLDQVRKALGPDYDVDKHFTPRYNPWDQRLCLIPNADLFEAIKKGKAAMVTDHIDCVTKKGIRLESGAELDADIIIVATGLEIKVMAGVQFSVDAEAVDFPETFSYKGMLYSGVPNMVHTFGYINASWTLRADLTAEYSCRLLNRMDELGMQQVTARLREEDRGMEKRPWIVGFSSGYMQRRMHLFPKQGDREPWLNTQDFKADRRMVRHAPLEDGALIFSGPRPA